jgi:RES domain-containing protein
VPDIWPVLEVNDLYKPSCLRYSIERTVTVKENHEYGRLLGAMKVAAARLHPWSGTIYRSAPPKWSASRAMLTGVGSMKSGARFNAPASFAAVYGSTTPELAMIESLAYQRRAGLPVERALPLVFKAISVEVERMLDLTDPAVLAELRMTGDQLRTEAWWMARARVAKNPSRRPSVVPLTRAAYKRFWSLLPTHPPTDSMSLHYRTISARPAGSRCCAGRQSNGGNRPIGIDTRNIACDST